MSFKVEVRVGHSDDWFSNGLRFPTKIKAIAYSILIKRRWTAVRQTRITECNEPANTTESAA